MTEEQRLQQLREISREHASAKAQREYLDHFRKSKLAMLTSAIMDDGKISHAAAETRARTDQEYLDLLHGLREATELEARTFWELKIAMAGIEIWRSKQATERAERKGYGA